MMAMARPRLGSPSKKTTLVVAGVLPMLSTVAASVTLWPAVAPAGVALTAPEAMRRSRFASGLTAMVFVAELFVSFVSAMRPSGSAVTVRVWLPAARLSGTLTVCEVPLAIEATVAFASCAVPSTTE